MMATIRIKQESILSRVLTALGLFRDPSMDLYGMMIATPRERWESDHAYYIRLRGVACYNRRPDESDDDLRERIISDLN